MELVIGQLDDRFAIESKKRGQQLPVPDGPGCLAGQRKLGLSDEVGEVLKHGTLSIGFIGLAETLISLYGHHHGESDAMQERPCHRPVHAPVSGCAQRTHPYELQLAGHPGGGSFRPFCTHGQKALRADSRRDGQGLLHQFFPYPCVRQYLGL